MKTLNEYEKQVLEKFRDKFEHYASDGLSLSDMMEDLEKHLLETIRETVERTLNVIGDGEGWEESREYYRKILKQDK